MEVFLPQLHANYLEADSILGYSDHPLGLSDLQRGSYDSDSTKRTAVKPKGQPIVLAPQRPKIERFLSSSMPKKQIYINQPNQTLETLLQSNPFLHFQKKNDRDVIPESLLFDKHLIFIILSALMNPMNRRLILLLIVMLLLAGLCEARQKGRAKGGRKKANKEEESKHSHYLKPHQPQFWLNALLATFLALAGGFCSGMTVGLNSLSTLNLEIMLKSTNQQDRKMALRIMDVIHDHHLFLVTLLVGNAIVLESLPLVIHLLMPDWAAILFSTIIVLIVAEVVPMSYSTGTHKYIIAFYGAPLVSILIKAFWPLCYPIARGLDLLLGKQQQERILRRDFLTFINDRHKNYLDQLEIEFINRVMNIKNRSLKEIMVDSKGIFAMDENAEVTEAAIRELSQKEHSFIPVYAKQKENIVGYVSSKEVIIRYLLYGKEEVPTLKKLAQGKIIYKSVRIYSDAVAIEALSVVEKHKCKILLICDIKKHKEKQSEFDNVLSVYEPDQWLVPSHQKIVGVITINQLLDQVADFPAITLRSLQRKLSRHPSQEQQPQL